MNNLRNHLDSLNEEQRKAVLRTEGPVLIVAGAGAGKTKTITHRILHLIESGVAPESVLAITFTNKAAKEMKERVWSKLSGQRRTPFISTFHSLGVQIIKENADLLKLPRHFNIFDTSDSKKALKEALVSLGVDPKDNLDKIRHIISKEKGCGVDMTDYAEINSGSSTGDLTKRAWIKYEEILSKERALDFDDLLLKTLKLLRKYPDVLERLQNRFLYIHIDEYQDTNKVQNAIVELLAKKHGNICVVGDTDQNIYSWRGAEIKNMLHFEKTYPEVQTFFLEQNYRSTKNILAVANGMIEKNNFRIPKKLFTENRIGEKISLFRGRNEVDEAHFVALKSKELIENGTLPDQIAVLYRANFQSRVLEDAFVAYGVPYQMLGTKFFERKEVKDVMSLIKASLSGESLSDFGRVVNVPPRGIGKVTLQKIAAEKEGELPESTKIKINNFRKMLLTFRAKLTTDKPSQALKHIIKVSGMEEMYRTGREEDTERLENIMELVTIATSYDVFPAEEGIEKFLSDTALASDQDFMVDGDPSSRAKLATGQGKNGVKLLTVHSSKGLEFDYVFIAGLEADLFPHKGMGSMKKSGEDGEEERRLFYVALTRAGKKLFLTHAETRTIFGTMEVNSPSEFLDDIPEKYLETESYSGVVSKPIFSIEF